MGAGEAQADARVAGHRKGVEALRGVIRAAPSAACRTSPYCLQSENWRRPQEEVTLLMELFLRALENEVARLHENDIAFASSATCRVFPSASRR